MYEMKNPSRLIVAGTPAARRFYTAARRFYTAAEEEDGELLAMVASRPPRREGGIFSRLSAVGATAGMVSQEIFKYVREGKIIKRYEFSSCAKELRKFHRFHQALEIFQWMEQRGIKLTYPEHSIRLDLISKTEGIAAAESYFDGLSLSAKNQWTYGALLHCYCDKKMTDRALAFFQKMEGMGMGNELAFNSLIYLYKISDQPEKVPPLVEEMKRRNISLNTFTYNCWMNCCASLNDMEAVDKVAEEMEKEGKRMCDWSSYTNLAAIYIKAGLFEKADLALGKLEARNPRERSAYHFQISLYAGTSNLDAVYRVSNRLKSNFTTTNTSYLIMLQAFAKLDAADGLEKCFKEWQFCRSCYDVRLANVTIKAYLRWDMLEDAQRVFHEATERSPGPFSTARELFMEFFLRKRQTDLALGHMEAAVSGVGIHEWQPKPNLVKEFFTCFQEKKDVEGAEELCRMLRKLNCLDCSVYQSFIQTYLAAGRVAPEMRRRIEKDRIEISSDLEDLLKIVCTK